MLACEEDIALLSEADPFQRVLDALDDGFEQGNLCFVEALVVEACDADHAAPALPEERPENELPDSGRSRSPWCSCAPSERQGARPAFVLEQARTLVGRQTVGAYEGADGSTVTRRQDNAISASNASQSSAVNELAELSFRTGEVDDRDELRAPRRLDEAPNQLVAAVSASSRVRRRPGHSSGLLSHRGSVRSLPVCRPLRARARGSPNEEMIEAISLEASGLPNHSLLAAQSKSRTASAKPASCLRARSTADVALRTIASGSCSQTDHRRVRLDARRADQSASRRAAAYVQWTKIAA